MRMDKKQRNIRRGIEIGKERQTEIEMCEDEKERDGDILGVCSILHGHTGFWSVWCRT